MLARFGNVFLIVALLAATGSHWAILQTVAWTGMLASNLRDGTFSGAIERTFDGKHPCCLCKQIAAGKKAGKKSESFLQLKKFEFLAGAPRFVFAAPIHFWLLTLPDFSSKSVGHTPPTPPPRCFFV